MHVHGPTVMSLSYVQEVRMPALLQNIIARSSCKEKCWSKFADADDVKLPV